MKAFSPTRAPAWTRMLLLGALVLLALRPTSAATPTTATIVGNLQSELGCASDNDPACTGTRLTYDANDDVWQRTLDVPAGTWSYRVALDDGNGGTYGAGGALDGQALTLTLAAPASVKFYYDNKTRHITVSTLNRPDRSTYFTVTAPGNFQSELGCPGDWQPDCLRSMLQDADGDGVYTLTTTALPAGNYEGKVAINESWDENYGEGGARGGSNLGFAVPSDNAEVRFRFNSTNNTLSITIPGAPAGNIGRARAHWLTPDTLAWPLAEVPEGAVAKLHYDADGAMTLLSTGVQGGASFTLTRDPAGLSAALKAKFPHLASAAAFKLPTAELSRVPAILKGQIALSLTSAAGEPLDATSAQFPGVLDELYTYSGQLGVVWNNGVPTLRVWAPTARGVKLLLFNDSNPATPPTEVAMQAGDKGTWSATGDASWKDRFYLYEVQVYVRATNRVETNRVTDPYSVSLSMNSQRSQIVDLSDAALKPQGWDTLRKPALAAPEDIVLYELHVRDFSINDQTVPEPRRGTFLAFAEQNANGMRHLARLARAGVTHVHLLPAFDIATINEDRSQLKQPAGDLAAMAPNSDQQQAAVHSVRDEDGFNWGYDPYHFDVPEGSYSTNPDGSARILEFREMVKGLSGAGLRTVMDVVYNHTNSSGQNSTSVFDRIVPGYYHRLNSDGNVETSTCCQNTASEHAMFEKFMVDSFVHWAKVYKVDGFRVDLMGHHMKVNMEKVRDALRALTVARDGVDGSSLYVYGEGWNFGEVANNQRGVNATQLNLPGTGIGTFTDRLRDAARGGGPFNHPSEQGFISGLFDSPNSHPQGNADDQRSRLLHYQDLIRVGLAANLADYELVNQRGERVKGSAVDYNGSPAGYAKDPSETINYVSAHDNETLFDAVQLKAPASASLEDRVRMSNLGVSLVALAQGIPFFHAGDELLRSKSMDRNSYNSGDWFNKMDFTYESNNWGVGLPPQGENGRFWEVMGPLLANPALKAGRPQITRALEHFEEMIRIRKSTPLFRLRTAEEVQKKVRFFNSGPTPVPGLVVMGLSDEQATDGVKYVVVVFNANQGKQEYSLSSYAGLDFKLHPVQAESTDPVVRDASFNTASGTFTVPGRSTAVFISSGNRESPPAQGCACNGTGSAGFGALGLLGALALLVRRRRAVV
jgi:pullulanase